MTNSTRSDPVIPSPAAMPPGNVGRPDRCARRAAARRHRGALVDELLAHLGRPRPAALARDLGTVALAFGPADPNRGRVESLCRLSELRLAVLRYRWHAGRPSLPRGSGSCNAEPPLGPSSASGALPLRLRPPVFATMNRAPSVSAAAPVVTIVGYEAVGHRHMQDHLSKLRA